MLTWETALKDWALEMRAAGISAGTIGVRISYLRRWSRVCQHPQSATRPALVAWMACDSWSPETRRSARQSIQRFYRWANDEGLISHDPAARLPRVKVPEAEPRPAPEDAIKSALRRATPRIRMMIMLAAVSGLRRAEVAQVHTRHLEGHDLVVNGKGGKVRVITLPGVLAEAIRAYPPGYLFPSHYQWADQHLTPPYVGKLIKRTLRDGYTTHQLRHAAATELHEQGLSLLELRDTLGHASVATTQRYVKIRRTRAQTEMAKLAQRLAG